MATTTTEDVDIPGRLIRLRDNENGSIYWLGNAPAFNRAWMQRPDDSRRVSTTAGAIADRLGATQAVFIRALVAIWEHATASGGLPGPGVPQPAPAPDPLVPPGGGDDPMLIPGPGLEFPPIDPGDSGGGQVMPESTIALSVLLPAVRTMPIVMNWIRNLFGSGVSAAGARIAVPGWLRTILAALGLGEIIEIFVDIPDLGDIFGGPAFGGREDPVTAMVEAMTVSTWDANGVEFHRLSDGRLAVRNKHGVWKIWRPRKPVVLFTTGNANLKDILKADRILQKEAKKISKLLRNRGFKVART
jgi:hypothetical protein